MPVARTLPVGYHICLLSFSERNHDCDEVFLDRFRSERASIQSAQRAMHVCLLLLPVAIIWPGHVHPFYTRPACANYSLAQFRHSYSIMAYM